MKFDVVIGNPPYQDNTIGDNDTFAPPVYDKFMSASYAISNKVELIHPARFLFNAGSTSKSWNNLMLQDKNLKILSYWPKSKDVFANTDIKGGIVISYHDTAKDFGAIEVFTPFKELNSIRSKVYNDKFSSFSDIIYSAYSYHLSADFYDENPTLKNVLSTGHEYDFKSNIFSLMPEVFLKEKPSDDYAQILGRENNQRTYRWIKKKYVIGPENFEKYKVFVAGANGCGAIGETLSTPVIGAPVIGAPVIGTTESFISIGSFETIEEAEHCNKYLKTKFSRVILAILKVTQAITSSKFKYVPLQDFTDNSDIDWSKSIHEIDLQLYKKYGLDENEINFIETHVKEME